MNKIIITASAIIVLGASATFATVATITNTQETSSNLHMMSNHQKGEKKGTSDYKGISRLHRSQYDHDYKKEDGKRGMMNDDIKKSLEANDYTAFTKAFNTMIADKKIPTQTEFDAMVKKSKNREANKSATTNNKKNSFESAIKANDYTAFIKAFETNKPTTTNSNMPVMTVPTQAEFTTMVDMFTKHEAVKSAILANDYNTFLKADAAITPSLPTQAEFTKMVELYNTAKNVRSEIKNDKQELKNDKATNAPKSEIKNDKAQIKDGKKTIKNIKVTKRTVKFNKRTR